MRENPIDNNLFFTCSLIEYISRKTKNKKKLVISKLGVSNIKKIFTLADVYHCENIDKVSDEFIDSCHIDMGNYDIVKRTIERVPGYFEIGRVYQRLIMMVDGNRNNYVKTLMEVLSSWLIEKIDNYNSSLYYENPSYIYACYKEGEILP